MNIDTFEPVLFTQLNVQAIGQQKASEVHKSLILIAKKWGLNISRQHEYDIAYRILKNEVKNQ